MHTPLQIPKINTEELLDFVQNLSPEEEQEIREKLELQFKSERNKRFINKLKSLPKKSLSWIYSNILEIIAIVISIIALLKP